MNAKTGRSGGFHVNIFWQSSGTIQAGSGRTCHHFTDSPFFSLDEGLLNEMQHPCSLVQPDDIDMNVAEAQSGASEVVNANNEDLLVKKTLCHHAENTTDMRLHSAVTCLHN